MPGEIELKETTMDAVIKFGKAFGVAGIVLAYLLVRGEPIVKEHFFRLHQYMEASEKVQQQQADQLNNSTVRITRIEALSERTSDLVRDIHGRVVNKPRAGEAIADK